MTKPVIVTRATKGSPLTRTELDNNFANIDNATIGISAGATSGTLDLNDQLTFGASGNATVAYNSSTKTITVGASGASTISGLTDVNATGAYAPADGNTLIYSISAGKWQPGTVTPTSPTQLTQNLSVNGYSIVSTSNGNITIAPNGSGNIQLTPASGKVTISATDFPTGSGTSGQVLTTNGSGTATWSTISSSGGSSVIAIISDSGSYFSFDGNNGNPTTNNFVLASSGGVSGVSVSTNSFTLPSGTYQLMMPFCFTSSTVSGYAGYKITNTTDSTTILESASAEYWTTSGSRRDYFFPCTTQFTITASKTFQLIQQGSFGSTWYLKNNPGTGSHLTLTFIKLS